MTFRRSTSNFAGDDRANMPEPSTVCAEVNGRQVEIKFPFSDSMQKVVGDVLSGFEYPIFYPKGFLPTTILDVGGNVGAAAVWFHAHYPNAQVYSLEPSPSLFEFLEANVAGYPAIVPLNVGLSNETGQGHLHVSETNAAQNSLIRHAASGDKTEPVTIYRASELLDDLQLNQISILKLDTEGYELTILRDLENRFHQIEAIYVEYHSEDDRRAIDSLLAEHFYLIHARVHFPNLGTLVYFSRESMDQSNRYISPPLGP